MNKTTSTLGMATLMLAGVYTTPTLAQNKVVVIPLRGNSSMAPVQKTGQVRCTYDANSDPAVHDWQWDDDCTNTNRPPGQDGELQSGMAWPDPRFSDNGDGTVADNFTGLVWLKNANGTTFFSTDATGQNSRLWSDALSAAHQLANGYCGLTDGSSAGDWHIPSKKELLSIIHDDYYDPALSNAAGKAKWTEGDAFIGVLSYNYWSSTTSAISAQYPWLVFLYNGHVDDIPDKRNSYYVWPVRGQ